LLAVTPREVRLSIEPVPEVAAAIASAITSTAMIVSSNPDRAGVEDADDARGGDDEHSLNEERGERDQARGALVGIEPEKRHERLARHRVVDCHHADSQPAVRKPTEPPADLRTGQT
jgi:hypothetical protein